MSIKYTPMIEQYLNIKKDYADCLVFFRLGDFYEMFFDDAIVASKELEIALTARDGGGGERIPMCGVPFHSVTPYIEKLINKGYKVAMVEQVSEPGKGLVERKVVKLITPGMIVDDGILDQKENNYIGAVSQDKLYFSLSYSDVSTGEIFLIENLRRTDLIKEIDKLNLKELILTKELSYIKNHLINDVLISFHEEIHTDFKIIQKLTELSKGAAGLLLSYLSKIEPSLIDSFNEIKIVNKDQFLQLDQNSLSSLELISSNYRGDNSLFKVLDKNQTAMGSRLLKNMIVKPLMDEKEIHKRLHFVEVFKDNSKHHNALIESLKGVYDLKRISTRMANLNVSPKDLSQLKNTLYNIPFIVEALKMFADKRIIKYADDLDSHEALYQLLEDALIENPPLLIKEGGIFKKGYNETLDELKSLSKSGKEWIKQFEEQEREKTGIRNLRVGYNRVFGYYIEVTKGNVHLIKEEYDYVRKQTLVNSERFINQALKEKEEIILNAADKIVDLEYELFIELRDYVKSFAQSLQQLADKIAFIDVMQSLAMVAKTNNYVKPEFKEDKELFIEGGRHPMVEVFQKEPFIENDVSIIDGGILLITGPNMSGKSTYMRMVAIIVIMAQMGSFVPAKVAKTPIYDAIYTRIGAQDDLTRGRSTFMVEMLETNEALIHATPNSLLIFDEIGRGTATYDGMALAQGIIEYIHQSVKSALLFSTHYHELTHLEKALKRLKNIHVSAILEKGKLVFLHKVKEGPTDKSYGINVAALAKLPKPLIRRSQIILDHFEEDKQKELELTIFNYESLEHQGETSTQHDAFIERLKSIDVDHLTPIEALLLLKELQEEV